MIFPGRMAEAARWEPIAGRTRRQAMAAGAPRIVFISDMGDALSRAIPFEYLQSEIIDIVDSEAGRRHLWLWLTSARTGWQSLATDCCKAGIRWPDNLVA